MTILLLSPVVLFVFATGVYIGMSLVSNQPPAAPVEPRGLPGDAGNLRGSVVLVPSIMSPHEEAHHRATAQSLPPPAPPTVLGQEDTQTVGSPTVLDAAALSSLNSVTDSTHAIDNAGAIDFRESLHVDGLAHFAAFGSLDSQQLAVGAWIRLDELAADNSMRTIFSNKKAGCGTDSSRHGVSMYVNEWETSNQILYVEYGSLLSGCEKVSSGSVKILPNMWHHVAVTFIQDSAVLYLDGAEVGRRENSAHVVQDTSPMIVGHYDAEGSFALFGNVSHFAVVHGATSDDLHGPSIVRDLMDPRKVLGVPHLHALFTFREASSEDPNTVPVDAMKRSRGKYTFSNRGKLITGLKVHLRDGTNCDPLTEADLQESDRLARERRTSVKEGMQHSWAGYKAHAWGRDELKPGSKRGTDNWGGIGCTLVDALDTLWLMGMMTEFKEAVEWVRNSLSFDRAGTVSTFETTIRELGGLLAAYDLSGETILLDKAEDLGHRLAKSFNTRSGIPTGSVNLNAAAGAPAHQGGSAVLSELGTLQVEFRYLAEATKNRDFETKAMKAFQVMHTKNPSHGLYPIKVSLSDGSFVERHVTFGALGDSFYEYLLKVWIQGGKKETWLREMYDESINGVVDVLLKTTKKSGLAYLSDWDGRSNIHKMDHLVCFMPGILALGSVTDPKGKDSPRAKRDMAVAKALMFTCRYSIILFSITFVNISFIYILCISERCTIARPLGYLPSSSILMEEMN